MYFPKTLLVLFRRKPIYTRIRSVGRSIGKPRVMIMLAVERIWSPKDTRIREKPRSLRFLCLMISKSSLPTHSEYDLFPRHIIKFSRALARDSESIENKEANAKRANETSAYFTISIYPRNNPTKKKNTDNVKDIKIALQHGRDIIKNLSTMDK